MSNTGASSGLLAPGLMASPKLRKTFSPAHTPQAARSRRQSFDGSSDKTIKKSLVEEFYKKEAKSKQRSYTDISGTLGAAGLRPNGSFSQLSDVPAPEDRLFAADLERPPDDRIAAGKLRYVWNDRHVGFSDNTAEKLINLDRNGTSLTLEQVDEAVGEAIRAAGRSHGVHGEANASEAELAQVEAFVRQQTAEVDEMHRQLRRSVELAKGRYREKLRASMGTVQELRDTLAALATRVDAARARVHGCKQVLGGCMADKLTLLDDVCTQFEKYDREVRRQRVWYVAVAAMCCGVAALAYAVVLGRGRWA